MKNQLEEQFVNMLEKHKGEFYKVAYSYVKTEENSLDIISESTYNALNALYTLREPKHMKTWFYRILINSCKQFLRKNKRIVYNSDLIKQIPTDTVDRDELLDLYESVNQLQLKYREVILLKYFKQMSIDEIADILKLNPNTVKTRLRRGITKLKTKVGGIENE